LKTLREEKLKGIGTVTRGKIGANINFEAIKKEGEGRYIT